MILFYQLADIANESLQGSPLYEIMWRGWMEDCKSIITNRRPFLSAGWLLAEGWLTMITCRTRKAEILKAEQVERLSKKVTRFAMAEKLSA